MQASNNATDKSNQGLDDSNNATAQPEITHTLQQIGESHPIDSQKPQKKKKTRCTKCKVNVGVIGEYLFNRLPG